MWRKIHLVLHLCIHYGFAVFPRPLGLPVTVDIIDSIIIAHTTCLIDLAVISLLLSYKSTKCTVLTVLTRFKFYGFNVFTVKLQEQRSVWSPKYNYSANIIVLGSYFQVGFLIPCWSNYMSIPIARSILCFCINVLEGPTLLAILSVCNKLNFVISF